jgi:hypothetical protein
MSIQQTRILLKRNYLGYDAFCRARFLGLNGGVIAKTPEVYYSGALATASCFTQTKPTLKIQWVPAWFPSRYLVEYFVGLSVVPRSSLTISRLYTANGR